MKKSTKLLIPLGGAVIVLLIVLSMLFTVDETEQALVTQFGRPIRTIQQAGLHVKLPDPLQSVMTFDGRLLAYDVRPSEYLTADKKNVVVSSFVCFRIEQPELFYRTVGNEAGARVRLGDLVASTTGAGLGELALSSLLNIDPESVEVEELMKRVTDQCGRAAKDFGVEVVSVRMKRIALPDQNLYSVFDRMRAERERIAKKYRAEGEEEAAKIRAEADRQKREILAEAKEAAERLRGQGEAEAARIYAEAYQSDPDFYRFLRTLEAYQKFLGEKSTLMLSSNSEIFSLLESAGGME